MGVKRKWIETVEVLPGEKFEIPKNHQVISSKVVISERADPGYPDYKTVIVMQAVEYDEEFAPRPYERRPSHPGFPR